MSYENSPDEVEVASDFLEALRSLNMNNRYEISNLTIIAKENIQFALAISEALKDHIKQTSPAKKLPAFYVLDSIVKNVGTPYTLFFGRQLYQTFMEAYALMDNNTRKKMDEMLKTWKEPVPGSMDQRPVFPPDITRPIENALIKARTSALEAHQQYQRSQPQMGRGRQITSPAPYRDTSTPPVAVRQPMPSSPFNYPQSQYPTPQPYAVPQSYPTPQSYSTSQQYPVPQQYPTPQPYPIQMNAQEQQPYGPPSQQYPQQPQSTIAWQQSPPQGFHTPDNSVEALNSDISSLITSSKVDFAQNPGDISIQTRLKALLDLQSILTSQRLPPDQIVIIKDQVAQLSKGLSKGEAVRQPVPETSTSSILFDLMPYNKEAQAPTGSSGTDTLGTSTLLEKLRAAGILKDPPSLPVTTPLPTRVPSAPPFLSTHSRAPLADISLTLNAPTYRSPNMVSYPNDVVLNAQSLKIPRPHLIYSLYDKLGTPCNQCGRRFKLDEEGKTKKTAHMDWHFNNYRRIIHIANRGQHREWYLDDEDWVKYREENVDQADITNDSEAANNTPAKPKVQYITVPDDPALANSVCPICQEKHITKWHEDTQDFVWMDAKKIGEKYYHASCYAELYQNGGKSQALRLTSEPVLGKRKAEDEPPRSRMKTEPLEY